MKKKISIITAILAALCMSIPVQAETEIKRITNNTVNSYENILPAVHGNYVVWQGRQNDEWEIFLYDIAADEILNITGDDIFPNNDYHDIAPQTDGRYVVWLEMNNPGGNIFYYDTDSPSDGITQVTDNWSVKSPPRIADSQIVWAAQEANVVSKTKTVNWGGDWGSNTEDIEIDVIESVLPGDIMMYEIEAEIPGPTNISASVDSGNILMNDHTPLIDNTKVVWVQTSPDNLESTVFVYDLSSPDTPPVQDNFAKVQSPTQDGGLSITTRFDGQDKEIFLSHQRLRKNIQLTDNSVDEKQPKIHGNHLVWVSGQGAEQEIYLGIVITDTDGDGVLDVDDNCPMTANTDQADNDGDGQGDVCDDDDDNDGILDIKDICPYEDSSGFDADHDGCVDTFSGLTDLINKLVTQGIIDENLANPLITKVENAEKSATKDNICAAVNQLEAFNNQIEAKRENPLSGELADQFIHYAENIISQILAKLPAGESCP